MSAQPETRKRRKPFTLRERRKWSQDYGYRHRNNWGSGDLPAPFCAGDVVRLVGEPNERLRGQTGPFFVVTYGPSIDEGDAWYFRVYDGNGLSGSDRLHVASADRCTWDEDVDWMACFELVETIDPEGLALRQRMLADGWSYTPPLSCPECGQDLPRASFT